MSPRPSTAVPLVSDGDQIAARGIFESVEGVLFNLQARLCHAWRVGQAQITLVNTPWWV